VTYKEARVYLDEMSKYGSVLGLDTIRNLMQELGNPQDDLCYVHIAGTNGKGSVLAYTSTILSEAGYRTGRYVSPTVVSYLERIQVDGNWITEQEFAELTEMIQKAIVRMETRGLHLPTVFEIETAIAFLHFQKKKCDIVVLETGLGGDQDATNIIRNTKVAVFTPISMDHMGFLGNSIDQIARKKAGIIKEGCSVVSGVQEPLVKEILKEKSRSMACPMQLIEKDRIEILSEDYTGQCFTYKESADIEIGLAGVHQAENAATAYEVIEELGKQGYRIPKEALESGFARTRWPGRFTCIHEKPVFMVDGAHNENAVKRLKEAVEKYFPGKRLLLIMGVFRDKEYEKMAEIMAPLAEVIYTVDLPDENRSLPKEELKKVTSVYCARSYAAESIEAAVEKAYREAGSEDVILAFGSLSYMGQMIKSAENWEQRSDCND